MSQTWAITTDGGIQAAVWYSPHHIISLLTTCSQQAGGVNQQTIAAWTVKKIITVSVNSVMNYENTTGQGRGKEGGIKESGMLKNLIKKQTSFCVPEML